MSETTGGPSAMARVSSGELVLPSARSLRSDDVVFLLREENMLTEDRKELHRYQLIVVERDDRHVEYVRDLGPVSKYPGVGPLIIFADGEEDTVDMLMEAAEAEREINTAGLILEEIKHESTFKEDAIRMAEQRLEVAKRNQRTLPRKDRS